MDSDHQQAGLQAANAFIAAFNAQDHPALAQTLNYPHIRLAKGQFYRVESPLDFAARSAALQPALIAEGWDHTVVREISAVHAGDDKVHLGLTIDRCHSDGSAYNTFETFWVATQQAGHWGIQFRSSFLR